MTFTRAGEALYLHSSSELQRISLSTNRVTKAHCALNLPPNARAVDKPAEEVREDGRIEGTSEIEGETQGSHPVPAPRSMSENGSLATSE